MNDIEHYNIIEMWRLRRIGGLSSKDNIVVLFTDGSHLCTCMEIVTKGIICRHFWRVMLYSSLARFHISIIPARWYKDEILGELAANLENSPVLTAIEHSTTTSTQQHLQIAFTLERLHNRQGCQGSDNEAIRRIVPQRNRFGIAFSTAKTAINLALETNSDSELIRLLTDFIAIKRQNHNEKGGGDNNLEANISRKEDDIVPLQLDLINQITDPNVTKIRGAPCKKRIKSAIEISKRRGGMEDISNVNNQENIGESSTRSQRRCLLCGKPGHYQKKCPNGKGKSKDNDEYIP